MKLLITLILLTYSVYAKKAKPAAPVAPVKAPMKRSITDLMYMPSNDVNYIRSGLKLYSQENVSKQALGGNTSSEVEVDTLNAHFTYGRNVMDDLFLTGYFDYDLDSEKTAIIGSTTSTTNSAGISDPTIEVKYRALHEDTDKLIFDYRFAFSPKFGTAKIGSITEDGNNLRGGMETSLGIEVGRRFSLYSFSLEASFTYTGSLESTDLSDDSLLKTKNRMDYVVRLNGQYNFYEDFFFRGAVSLNSLGDYDERTDVAATSVTYNTSVTYYLTLGYTLNKDTLFNLKYTNNTVDRDTSRLGVLTNQEIGTSSINAFVSYQFM